MVAPSSEDADNCLWPSNARQLREWITILGAAGFHYHVDVSESGAWVIELESAVRAEAARLEIQTVNRMNRGWPPRLKPLLTLENNPAGPFVILIVLLFLYGWLGPYDHANGLHRNAASNAARFQAGEWWRVVTALGQHADIGHLLGNCLFLFLLGWFVCRKFGDGVGLLLILLSGVLGNSIVASLVVPHISVGASTSSFGALGLICSAATVEYGRQTGWGGLWGRAWLPIGAGLAMLGLTGAGEGSDLGAHVFGFLMGVLLALPLGFSSVISRRVQHGWVQGGAGIAAAILFLVAWLKAGVVL